MTNTTIMGIPQKNKKEETMLEYIAVHSIVLQCIIVYTHASGRNRHEEMDKKMDNLQKDINARIDTLDKKLDALMKHLTPPSD